MLVVFGPGAAMVSARTHAFGRVGVTLAFGLAETLVVASSGHIGGAHINPAVTIGFWSVGRFPAREVLPYVIAQCVGAIAASALLAWLLGRGGGLGETVPQLRIARSFVVELGLAGIPGFVIMGEATDERTPPAFAPFAIGATVCLAALTGGPLTGASLNPARTLGPASTSEVWTAHWLYWIAPIAGMVIGMRLCDALSGEQRIAAAEPMGTEGLIDKWRLRVAGRAVP